MTSFCSQFTSQHYAANWKQGNSRKRSLLFRNVATKVLSTFTSTCLLLVSGHFAFLTIVQFLREPSHPGWTGCSRCETHVFPQPIFPKPKGLVFDGKQWARKVEIWEDNSSEFVTMDFHDFFLEVACLKVLWVQLSVFRNPHWGTLVCFTPKLFTKSFFCQSCKVERKRLKKNFSEVTKLIPVRIVESRTLISNSHQLRKKSWEKAWMIVFLPKSLNLLLDVWNSQKSGFRLFGGGSFFS